MHAPGIDLLRVIIGQLFRKFYCRYNERMYRESEAVRYHAQHESHLAPNKSMPQVGTNYITEHMFRHLYKSRVIVLVDLAWLALWTIRNATWNFSPLVFCRINKTQAQHTQISLKVGAFKLS